MGGRAVQNFDMLLGMSMALGSLEEGLKSDTQTETASTIVALKGLPSEGGQCMSNPVGCEEDRIMAAAIQAGLITPGANASSGAQGILTDVPTSLAKPSEDSGKSNATSTGNQTISSSGQACSATVMSIMGTMASPPRAITESTANSTGADQPKAFARHKAEAWLSNVLTSETATSAVSTQAAQSELRTWNMRELAQQLSAALDSIAPQRQQATASSSQNTTAGACGDGTEQSSTQATDPSASSLSFKSKVEGEKIRATGTTNLINSTTVNETKSTSARVNPVAGEPNQNNTSFESFIGSMKGQAQAQTALRAKAESTPMNDVSPAVPDMASPIQSMKTASMEWAAQPTAENAEKPRMPGIIEQVRQVADFLAERTDGVIKMGQQGMEANLKLYPPDLGQVRVELTVMNDRSTQAQFFVERPETAQLLQQHLQSFQDGLSRHGLVVDRVQVTIQTVRAPSASQESAWKQGEGQESRRGEEFGTQSRNSQGQKRGSKDGREPNEF